MKEQLELLEKKNMRLRKKLEQKPTSLKKLEKLLKERMDDMNEELGEIQLLKGKYGRVRNCVNKKWKEYPIRVDELKKVIELLNN
jgi:thymidylate synthase